jgi:DNA mismatch endonuclease, patch repair protein
MADRLTPAQRSLNMSRIGSKNTKPEKLIRSLLHRMGYRFRLHQTSLPGKPDIVLKKYSYVIFVHGCFWHRHNGCKYAFNPTSKTEYWLPKLKRNIERDKENQDALKKVGWNILIIWECELKNINKLKIRIVETLRKNDALP